MPEVRRKFITQEGNEVFETPRQTDSEIQLKIREEKDGMIAKSLLEKNSRTRIEIIEKMTDEEVLDKINSDREARRKLEEK